MPKPIADMTDAELAAEFVKRHPELAAMLASLPPADLATLTAYRAETAESLAS